MHGYIHSKETCGMVDGIGIRYVLFLQGCNVGCTYCHNPDTWKQEDYQQRVTVDEIVQDVLRYKKYFINYGVTLSGGEPLLQVEFVLELFKELKKHDIHTTIDTSGAAKLNQTIEEVLKYTDFIVLDVKYESTVNLIYSNYIRNFFDYVESIESNNVKLWVRQVIIKNVTDDLEIHDSYADILSFTNVERVELMPLHNMCKYKYDNLGLEYHYNNKNIPNEKDLEKIKEIYLQYNLNVI